VPIQGKRNPRKKRKKKEEGENSCNLIITINTGEEEKEGLK